MTGYTKSTESVALQSVEYQPMLSSAIHSMIKHSPGTINPICSTTAQDHQGPRRIEATGSTFTGQVSQQPGQRSQMELLVPGPSQKQDKSEGAEKEAGKLLKE
ncbi:hypothetical protein NDU88_005641 [Pleurodeles waltl]|uniref:Uncharacterized protein n=1 Tax=Pleurodeles waltl TaxID=8319 RepID=A0AAV7L3M3_PLEWA|nr:hypothetical protein NDU88_005641 [Pleurodeles waltl]